MNKRNALTLVELLVIISILVFLIVIMIPAFQYQKPKVYCRSNLKQLVLAWVMYSDENDGKFVNGAAGMNRPNEPAWIGRDWDPNYMQGKQLNEKKQIEAIKAGALYPYCKNEKVFKCPQSQKEFKRTYSIVDSLNGVPQPGNPMGRGPMEVMDKLIAKDRSQIQSPHTRAVFICVGWAAPGSYGVYYDKEKWCDPPPVQHNNGMTFVFADGHSEYWKWKGTGTIEAGKNRTPDYTPVSAEDREDLRDIRIAVWGEIP